MAYHLATRVLERVAGHKEKYLFADCVRYSLGADVPLERHVAAGHAAKPRCPTAGVMERHILELFAIDINPVVQLLRRMESIPMAVDAWNAYNEAASIYARWIVNTQGANPFRPSPKVDDPSTPYPGPCWDIGLSILDAFMGTVKRAQDEMGKLGPQPGLTVSELARVVGPHDAMLYEASLFFEENPGSNVTRLSRDLGCSRRTVERRFRDQGLTAIELKRACALAGATRAVLWDTASLTDVALIHGYADLAHMSKEIRRATGGLGPSLLRSLTKPRHTLSGAQEVGVAKHGGECRF